jgi:Peptidase A4 family
MCNRDANRQLIKAREESQVMPNRNGRGRYRGPARSRSRRRSRRNLGAFIAVGAAVPVATIGYFLTSPSAGHLAPVADVQNAGGWGRGGYPMVAGPAPDAGPGGVGWGGEAVSTPADSPASGFAAVTDVASENWAGYAATGAAGSFTSVSSSWAQPAVSCGGTDTFSAFWAGLDGDGTPTVEQTGTEADCDGGTASYQGWYEIFPNAPVFYPDPVQPGDDMSASVVADGDGIFTLTLSDATQRWTQATQQAETDAQLGSAEVIAEAPSNGTVLPLADFGTVNFTGVTVDNAPIGDGPNLSELTLSAPDGTALATPSALTAGNAFSVTSDGPGVSDGPGASDGEWYQG